MKEQRSRRMVDAAFHDIPPDIKEGIGNVYEAARENLGLTNLCPWDDLHPDEQLMMCSLLELGRQLERERRMSS